MTQPGDFCLVGEGLNLGTDPAEPITDDYAVSSFAFAGTTKEAVVDVSGNRYVDLELEAFAMMNASRRPVLQLRVYGDAPAMAAVEQRLRGLPGARHRPRPWRGHTRGLRLCRSRSSAATSAAQIPPSHAVRATPRVLRRQLINARNAGVRGSSPRVDFRLTL